MSTDLVVGTAGRAQWAEVADTLAAAFADDPVFGWLLPDAASRPRALRRFFAVEGRHRMLAEGVSVTATGADGLTGAVLALPPGRTGPPWWFQVRHGATYARVFGRGLPRAGRLQDAMARAHPSEPHLYLFSIGVRPEAQGRGVATTMLAPLLRRCDEDGLPAYLEASSPGSARLYARLGFVGHGTLRVGDSPPMELMTRRPRGFRGSRG